MTDELIGPRVYFDTNIFCEAFEGSSAKAERLKSIFRLGEQKPKRIVTSELTLAELAPGEDWIWRSRFYLNLIVFRDFIYLRPVSRAILVQTGDYRRTLRQTNRNVRLPDAIYVVTAVQARCDYVLTSDKRFVVPKPLERIVADPAGTYVVMNALDG